MTEAVQYVWTEIEKGGREINNQNETEGGSVVKKKEKKYTNIQKEKIESGPYLLEMYCCYFRSNNTNLVKQIIYNNHKVTISARVFYTH